jgi:Raf kinase inhibitor-like YbhB/YbcL family protein
MIPDTSTVCRVSVLCFSLVVATALGGCSSSKSTSDGGTGGSGTGGTNTGTGGTGTGGAGTAGTNGSGADAAIEGPRMDGGTTLTVTSGAFAEGETIPAANTCAGANGSPTIAWTQVPVGALSFAVLLTDLSISTIHWVIWDIKATTHALPADLLLTPALTMPADVAGAMQAHHVPFFGTTDNGYRGPCPSGALHNYQFEVHALDVAMLPGVTAASTPPDVRVQILAHSLGFGDLVGMSTASRAGQ